MTKNGYSIVSSTGRLLYERKSGSTFYIYTSTNEGLLRSETTLNIQEKYTGRILEEIKVHMFEFENYEYDSDDGVYRYQTTAFGSWIKFQNGYLTSIQYGTTGSSFVLDTAFETTIDIAYLAGGEDLSITITRPQFEELCDESFNKCKNP